MTSKKDKISDYFRAKSSAPSVLDLSNVNDGDEGIAEEGIGQTAAENMAASSTTEVSDTFDLELEKSESKIPDCWTNTQYHDFLRQNPWLRCFDGKLKCSACSEVHYLGVMKERGVSISKEWAEGSIAPSGGSKAARQKKPTK